MIDMKECAKPGSAGGVEQSCTLEVSKLGRTQKNEQRSE